MAKLRDNIKSTEKIKDIVSLTYQNETDFEVISAEKSHTGVNQRKENQRKVKVGFSKQDDAFILAGTKKHGKKWTVILNDPDYFFNSSRTTVTILTRAKACKLI